MALTGARSPRPTANPGSGNEADHRVVPRKEVDEPMTGSWQVPDPAAQGSPPVSPGTKFQFGSVYLLTSGPDGPTAVPGLRIELGPQGLSLARADGARIWNARWDQVSEFATPERSVLPDHGHGVVLFVSTHDGRSHRFVLPSDEPAALESMLEHIARTHGVHPIGARRTEPRVIVTGAIVIVVAVAIILFLSAGHVINI